MSTSMATQTSLKMGGCVGDSNTLRFHPNRGARGDIKVMKHNNSPKVSSNKNLNMDLQKLMPGTPQNETIDIEELLKINKLKKITLSKSNSNQHLIKAEEIQIKKQTERQKHIENYDQRLAKIKKPEPRQALNQYSFPLSQPEYCLTQKHSTKNYSVNMLQKE